MSDINVSLETATNSGNRVPNTASQEKTLPPIKLLFEESWHVFKKSLFQLFIFNGLYYITIGFIVFLIIGIYILLSLPSLQKGVSSWSIIAESLFGFLFIVSSATYFTIATIIAIDNNGQKYFGDICKMSYKLILPLVLVSFLTGILEAGGYFLFLFPGILFSLFFTFTTYEVILNNQNWLHAIKHSYSIVYKHFGEIFIRVLMMFGLMIIFSYLLPGIFERIVDKNILWLVYICNFVYQTVFGWFWATYYVVLYKQAKAVSENENEKSIRWISIVAAVGWGVLLVIITAVTILLINLSKSGQMQDYIAMYNALNGVNNVSTTFDNPTKDSTPTPVIQPWHAYTPDESRLLTALGLQQYLADYFASSGSYPATLDVFADKFDGKTPKDPKTNEPYEYSVNNGSYQLCMKFDSVGQQCVESTLDQSQKENNSANWASHTALTFTIKYPTSYAYDSRFASPASSDNPNTNVFIGNYRTVNTAANGRLKNASIFQIQKIKSNITDLATYANYNETGYVRKMSIHGSIAYKDSPSNTNPFYATDESNGISYKVYMQDNNKALYAITVFVSDHDPNAAQIFAAMLNTLTFAPAQNNLDLPTNLWSPSALADFTSSFEGKKLCLGQTYLIPFEIFRTPKQVDLNLYPPQANRSFPIEQNIPVTVKNDRVSQTYNWVVGQTADKLQILPGDKYKIGLHVSFGLLDDSDDFTSEFSIANCAATENNSR